MVTLLNRENLKITEFMCAIVEQVEEWYQVLLNIIQNEQSLEKAVRFSLFHATLTHIQYPLLCLIINSVSIFMFDDR